MTKSMTAGKEWKLILLFTLPLMAGNLLQQLYNTVDGIIVGNFVGENALSAVGTCSPLTLLFICVAIGMSTGASIAVSQLYGAQQLEEMRKCVTTALILLTTLGMICAILGVLGAGWLLHTVLGVQDYLMEDALIYFRIYAIGLVFQFIYNIVAAILRSLGDSRATLYFLMISSVCNIILDLIAVVVLHWNVMGVALATVLSQLLSATISVIYMFRTYKVLHFRPAEFRFYREKAMLILRLGIPTTIQQCVVSMSHMSIQRIVNSFDITAGYTAAMKIENFIMIPSTSFLQGVSTFTGQNIGAGKMDRVKTGLHSALAMATISVVIIATVVMLFTAQIVGLFGVTGDSLAIGVMQLHYVAMGFILFSWYFCFNGVLIGSGDVMFVMFNTVSCLILRTIAAYALAYLTPLGYVAIWWSLLGSWVYNVSMSGLRYRFGPWRKKCILQQQ